MQLSKILKKKLIICDLEGNDRKSIYMQMLHKLEQTTRLNTDVEDLYKDIIAHEELIDMPYEGSFAIPHTRSAAINDYHVIIGIHRQGVLLKENDASPSKIIVMSLISKNTASIYLLALKAFVNYFSQPGICERAVACQNPQEFIELIERDSVEVAHSLNAADVMLCDIPTIPGNASLRQAIDKLAVENGRTLAVIDNQDRLIGSINTQSILRSGLPNYILMLENIDFLQDFEPFANILREEDSLPLIDFINHSPEKCLPTTPMIQVLASLARKKTLCYYIVDNKGKLLGQISATEIIRNVLRG